MNKRIFLILLFLLFFITTPAFADGGIPLWIYTAHTAFGVTSMGAPFIAGILWTLPVLAFVVGIECLCVALFFKFKQAKLILKATIIGNIITTIIGSVITAFVYPIAVPHSPDISILIVGPYAMLLNGYGLVIANILLFLMSFIIEYYVARDTLKNIFEVHDIKTAYLLANIVSYIGPLLATIVYLISPITDGSLMKQENFQYFTISLLVVLGTMIFIYAFLKSDSNKSNV